MCQQCQILWSIFASLVHMPNLKKMLVFYSPNRKTFEGTVDAAYKNFQKLIGIQATSNSKFLGIVARTTLTTLIKLTLSLSSNYSTFTLF